MGTNYIINEAKIFYEYLSYRKQDTISQNLGDKQGNFSFISAIIDILPRVRNILNN